MASNYEMANRALGGALPDRLRSMREEGLTLQVMADRLNDDGLSVSLETVRRWCKRAGVPTGRVNAPVEAS